MPTDIDSYYASIDGHGLGPTWDAICRAKVTQLRPDLSVSWGDGSPSDIDVAFADEWGPDSFGDLYEAGLAHADKDSKKALGQYYTPDDTAEFMAGKLVDALADTDKVLVEPCVGCGNLLMAMLRALPDPWPVATGRMILFDLDGTAMGIAKARVVIGFAPRGASVDWDDLDCRVGDFLLSGFDATSDHVVISNPPYGRVANEAYSGHRTYPTRDLYPMFLEHLVGAHRASVIVPQSFLGSDKFSTLRAVMSEGAGGVVYAYDNVPVSMFNGRKHGVFNTNTTNSVRAAIVVSEAAKVGDGWHVTPMLRWVSEERGRLFEASDRLAVGARAATGDEPWPKVPPALVGLYEDLRGMPRLSSLVDGKGDLELRIPSTPRYFVTAARRSLDRSAFHSLRFSDESKMRLAYLVISSSVSYCWWRWHDGGISITRKTLLDIPVPCEASDATDELAEELIESEGERVIVKMNAGKPNENLKLSADDLDRVTRAILPRRTEAEYEALAASHRNNLADTLPKWEERAGGGDVGVLPSPASSRPSETLSPAKPL